MFMEHAQMPLCFFKLACVCVFTCVSVTLEDEFRNCNDIYMYFELILSEV